MNFLVGNAVPKKKASFAEKVKMGAFSHEMSNQITDMEKKKKEKGMFSIECLFRSLEYNPRNTYFSLSPAIVVMLKPISLRFLKSIINLGSTSDIVLCMIVLRS